MLWVVRLGGWAVERTVEKWGRGRDLLVGCGVEKFWGFGVGLSQNVEEFLGNYFLDKYFG